VSSALSALPHERWPLPLGDALMRHWARVAPGVAEALATGRRKPVSEAHFKSPIVNPTKVLGIARNRKNLEGEATDPEVVGQPRVDGDPMHFFLKATSALSGTSEGIALRFPGRRTDPEAELAIVIGRTGTDIKREDAFDHIFGYSIGLDTSLRGTELPSARKSIDTYATLGPWIVTRDEIANPDAIASTLWINNAIAQEANTDNFAFDVRTIVADASSFFTLYPGDVIMAGTPPQFKRIVAGDVVDVEFAGIGKMHVQVRAHSP
jgi:2,4-didehydro-3-deoxy-L-rhamnonate hydrolase